MGSDEESQEGSSEEGSDEEGEDDEERRTRFGSMASSGAMSPQFGASFKAAHAFAAAHLPVGMAHKVRRCHGYVPANHRLRPGMNVRRKSGVRGHTCVSTLFTARGARLAAAQAALANGRL